MPVVDRTEDGATSVLLPTVNCSEAVVITFSPKAEVRTALDVPENVALMSAGDFLGRTGLAPATPPSGTPANDQGVIASGNILCDDGSSYHAVVAPIESLSHENVAVAREGTVEFYSDVRALALGGPRLEWFALADVDAMDLNGSAHTFEELPIGATAAIEVVADGTLVLKAELAAGQGPPEFGFPIRAWLAMPDGSTATYDVERTPAPLFNAIIPSCETAGRPETAFGDCMPPTPGAIQLGFDETFTVQTYPKVPFMDLE